MAFSVAKILDKYSNQDPARVMRDGTIKSALIIFSFLAIAFVFGLNNNLMVLCILFMANLAASVLSGGIEVKRKVFFMYIVSAIFMMNISTYLHPFFEKDFMFVLPLTFVAFWVRRFGEPFLIFPLMIVVMTCICFIKFPLFDYNVVSFNIWVIIISLAFYIVLIKRYKLISKQEIQYVVSIFLRSFVKMYQETYDKSKFRKYTQTKILERSHKKFENIVALQSQGLMLLKKEQKESWRFFCYNMILINRLFVKFVINYKKFSNNHKRWGFTSSRETQVLSADIQQLFLETLRLTLIISSKSDDAWRKKIKYLEHLKYKFEMQYIEKYKNDKEKKNFLFSCILLLDDIFIAIENTKEAYDDFLTR